MIDDLVVVNLRPNGPEAPTAFTNLQWQTCLRRIVFLHRAELTLLPAGLNFEAYCGRDVYQFLLEVICGLHSPLLGENAVMGQFRKFRTSAQLPNTVWGRFLRTLTTDLLVDARLVRHHHLQGFGSQSYGSLIRRYLKGRSSVAVLGAGNLAREILPWLTDVRVFYRNVHHLGDLQDKHPHLQLEQFSMADAGWHGNGSSLVIAAPLDAAEIYKWLALQNVTFSTILDLRGNADADPIPSQTVISLSELLTSLQDERKRIERHVIAAQKEIELLTWQRFSERDSKRADCKPQIQTHSAIHGSAPLLEYRRLIPWSRDFERVERCHGLVPWYFTFAAKCGIARNSWMPRPCAVEVHVSHE
jgi:glutamyl-tRNA reductase